jgi:hypothetical protein
MPIHDWTRVKPGVFHDFHNGWCWTIRSALNRGRLPEGYFALVEQRMAGPEPDVVAIEGPDVKPDSMIAVAEKPKTKLAEPLLDDVRAYARKADRVVIHHPEGDIVAVIEIVSPGNKSTKPAMRSFVEKSATFIDGGVHLLVLDLFPVGRHDPRGVHYAIAKQFWAKAHRPSPDKPLTFVSYQAGTNPVAYIEPLSVGDPVPDMPLFITERLHVSAPLTETYEAALQDCPPTIRQKLEGTP